jgi:hypothetical protein
MWPLPRHTKLMTMLWYDTNNPKSSKAMARAVPRTKLKALWNLWTWGSSRSTIAKSGERWPYETCQCWCRIPTSPWYQRPSRARHKDDDEVDAILISAKELQAVESDYEDEYEEDPVDNVVSNMASTSMQTTTGEPGGSDAERGGDVVRSTKDEDYEVQTNAFLDEFYRIPPRNTTLASVPKRGSCQWLRQGQTGRRWPERKWLS